MGTYVINETHPHLGGNILEGDPATYCPAVWDWLVRKRSVVKTVLDVGCARGEALRFFKELGCLTMGIDGLPENTDACPPPVITADLAQGRYPILGIDLVWCCEVVEHIDEKYLENLLSTISMGGILAMTYAPPGQGGHHHVNCRPAQYWITNLERYDMIFDKEMTDEAKALGPEENHFSRHGLIFIKKDYNWERNHRIGKPVVAPHMILDEAKVKHLRGHFDAYGWAGRPLSITDCGDYYQALTGAHRLAALCLSNVDPEWYKIDARIHPDQEIPVGFARSGEMCCPVDEDPGAVFHKRMFDWKRLTGCTIRIRPDAPLKTTWEVEYILDMLILLRDPGRAWKW